MGTNGTETAPAPWVEEEAFRVHTLDRTPAAPEPEADRSRGTSGSHSGSGAGAAGG